MTEFKRFNKSDLTLIGSDFLKNGIRKEALDQWEAGKYSFTLWDGNRVIAVCGVVEIHQGVGEIWLILENDKQNDVFAIARSLKKLTDRVFVQSSFHRFQARASVDDSASNRFLLFLGFEREGILKQYGLNREDYSVYGRVKRWQQQQQ